MYKKISLHYHGRELSLEAGKVAKQASGAVVLRYGDTVALVTAVAERTPRPLRDFAPITVNYQEKFYAAGKIPGGFFKRENRPTDFETLNCRLIDRPIRPLFPKQWVYETQIIPTVLSADYQSNPGVMCILGASAALEISHIPFEGPVAGVQVGRINNQWIINPSYEELDECDVEMVVAGNRDGVAMVEGGANMVPEDEILEGIFYAYEEIKPLLDMQDELRQAVGLPKMEHELIEPPKELADKIEKMLLKDLQEAWTLPGKLDRYDRQAELIKAAKAKLVEEETDFGPDEYYFNSLIEKLEKKVVRDQIVVSGKRADGRKLDEIRQIDIETAVLPRTHGSALFTRGETQGIVTTTLGTRKDERKIERLEEDYYKTFFLHYNFPPYSVAETSMRLGPGRRDIGHGYLAERALARVLPEHEDFPYTIRIVSEITESNGSSSMATVCGGSLSLMDAGVPVKGQVAGVAMGLIKEEEGKFHVLTDIMGHEDHVGDMDFKVAGTADGVTAVQMDIKISGLDKEIMQKALGQAREARLFILDKMNAIISAPKEEMSPYAPRIVSLKIPVDKIKDLIGPGGKVIRGIQEETGAQIDVEDDGTVRVASADAEVNAKVVAIINDLMAEPEIGEVYRGRVTKVVDFGAFVEILPGMEGLLHISEIEDHRIDQVTDVLREGDEVVVKCIRIDQGGKVALSRREVLDLQPEGARAKRDDDDDDPEAPAESRPYTGNRPSPRGEGRPDGDDRRNRPRRKKKKSRPPRGERGGGGEDRY